MTQFISRTLHLPLSLPDLGENLVLTLSNISQVMRLKVEKGGVIQDSEKLLEAEKRKTQKRGEKMSGKLTELQKELDLERDLNGQLQKNQASLRAEVSKLEQSIREREAQYEKERTSLQEQIHDLMFHIQVYHTFY